jgi:hypothetical protein
MTINCVTRGQTKIGAWTVNRDLVTHVLFIVKDNPEHGAISVDTAVSYVMDEPGCRSEGSEGDTRS